MRANVEGQDGHKTLPPNHVWSALAEKALEASGCEHIQVPGFDVVGPRMLFFGIHPWKVQLGWLQGGGISGHAGGWAPDQIHG